MNPEIVAEKIPAPFICLLMGRDADEQYLLSAAFLALDDSEQEILVGESTVKEIATWISSGLLPQTHAVAIAKIIGMLALEDDISPGALPQILDSIGIQSAAKLILSEKITQLVQPFLEDTNEFEPETPPSQSLNSTPTIAPLSPLRTSKPVPVPPPPNRTTIDLRDKKLTP